MESTMNTIDQSVDLIAWLIQEVKKLLDIIPNIPIIGLIWTACGTLITSCGFWGIVIIILIAIWAIRKATPALKAIEKLIENILGPF